MQTSRGFSLIEVTVTIFIVGILLLMFQAILQSSILVRTTKSQGIALTIARNELETLRAGGYATLPQSGSFSNSLLSTLPSATSSLTVSVYNAGTKQVVAKVIWRESGSSASSTVSLSTLITQTGGLP